MQRTVFGMMPTDQHVAAVVQNFGFRHLFFGGDQHHRLSNVGAIPKHHGGLDGIADGARNQMQVVVGVGAQRKQRYQRQENPGGADGNQRQPKICPLQHPAQRGPRMPGAVLAQPYHSGGACLRANCSTLG